MRTVQIVTCVIILYLEIFALGCVTARFCIIEKTTVHWRLRYFDSFVSYEKLFICNNWVVCNFAFSVETLVTVKNCVTWKLRYCEKLRYLETALLEKLCFCKLCCFKNCVTRKLCCFEKLRYLKTVFLWKTVLLESWLVVIVFIFDTV